MLGTGANICRDSSCQFESLGIIYNQFQRTEMKIGERYFVGIQVLRETFCH